MSLLAKMVQSVIRFFSGRGILRPLGACRGCVTGFASLVGEDEDLVEFLGYMERLKNYEKVGVPRDAGTDTDDGFDLGRMRRLLKRLGDPHLGFPVSIS